MNSLRGTPAMAPNGFMNVPRIMMNVLFDTQECTSYDIHKDRYGYTICSVRFKDGDGDASLQINPSEFGYYRKQLRSQVHRNRNRMQKHNDQKRTQNSARSFSTTSRNDFMNTKPCSPDISNTPREAPPAVLRPCSPRDVLNVHVTAECVEPDGGYSLLEGRETDETLIPLNPEAQPFTPELDIGDIETILLNQISTKPSETIVINQIPTKDRSSESSTAAPVSVSSVPRSVPRSIPRHTQINDEMSEQFRRKYVELYGTNADLDAASKTVGLSLKPKPDPPPDLV